jgi:hypothetical protein
MLPNKNYGRGGGHSKLFSKIFLIKIRGGCRQMDRVERIHRQQGDLISFLSFLRLLSGFWEK